MSAAVTTHSTARNRREGRASCALPAPRQTASKRSARQVKIAHFTCNATAARASGSTWMFTTAAKPVPSANSAPTAPRQTFQVPTVASTALWRVNVLLQDADRASAPVSTNASGKCTAIGCHSGASIIMAARLPGQRASPPTNGIVEAGIQRPLRLEADFRAQPSDLWNEQRRLRWRHGSCAELDEVGPADALANSAEQVADRDPIGRAHVHRTLGVGTKQGGKCRTDIVHVQEAADLRAWTAGRFASGQ